MLVQSLPVGSQWGIASFNTQLQTPTGGLWCLQFNGAVSWPVTLCMAWLQLRITESLSQATLWDFLTSRCSLCESSCMVCLEEWPYQNPDQTQTHWSDYTLNSNLKVQRSERNSRKFPNKRRFQVLNNAMNFTVSSNWPSRMGESSRLINGSSPAGLDKGWM